MLESLLVYTLLFAVLCVSGVVAARRGKKYVGGSGVYDENRYFFSPEVLFIIVSFTIVFGCRWGVGRDYFRYLYAYTDVLPERFEFLFQGISSVLKKAGAHYSVYFSVWAFLDVSLLYYSIRKYKFAFPFIAFFLIFGSYYLPMMNGIRQYIAALVFLNSIEYIEKKQIIQFGVCFVIAVLFHKLSLILFVFYPLLRFKDDWFDSIVLQLVLFFIAVYLSLNGELVIQWIEMPFNWITDELGYNIYDYEDLTEDRYDRNRFGNNTGLGIWVKMLVTVPIVLYSKDLKSYYNSSYFNMLYTLYFFGVITSLLFGSSIVLNRIALFFAIYQLIIHSLFVYYCFDKKDYAHLIIATMIMIIQIPLFLNMISNPNSTAPFLFFWQQNLYS